MVRTKDEGGIKSNLIVTEVQKRPCLFDTKHPDYGDRAEKSRCWEEVCESVVPGWCNLEMVLKFAAGKEVQKRWRSIRDSYTKAYRQGKCVPAQCAPASRRAHYHAQMAFLLRALQNKKPRYSQDKYESFSEVSNSPQHPPPEDIPKIKTEIIDKPLDLKTKPDQPETVDKCNQVAIDKCNQVTDKCNQVTIEKCNEVTADKRKQDKCSQIPADKCNKATNKCNQVTADKRNQVTIDKCNQVTIDKCNQVNEKLEIKIDANSILPEDHFDDDKLFMNSLIPLFKKMDDDTRLVCRIEVLKIIRYALQGHKRFDALKMAEDGFFKNQMSSVMAKEELDSVNTSKASESRLSMTTRSADGTRPVSKRQYLRSPSPQPTPPKRRGPGRPRKVRPPSDSDEEQPRKRSPKTKLKSPVKVPRISEPLVSELDESLSKATSVAQLSTNLFMKMYNLGRSKDAPVLPTSTPLAPLAIKTEPMDTDTPNS